MAGRKPHTDKIALASDGSTELSETQVRHISIRTGISRAMLQQFLDGKLDAGRHHLDVLKKVVNGPVGRYFAHSEVEPYTSQNPDEVTGRLTLKPVPDLREGDAVLLHNGSAKQVWLVVEQEPKTLSGSILAFVAGGIDIESDSRQTILCREAVSTNTTRSNEEQEP